MKECGYKQREVRGLLWQQGQHSAFMHYLQEVMWEIRRTPNVRPAERLLHQLNYPQPLAPAESEPALPLSVPIPATEDEGNVLSVFVEQHSYIKPSLEWRLEAEQEATASGYRLSQGPRDNWPVIPDRTAQQVWTDERRIYLKNENPNPAYAEGTVQKRPDLKRAQPDEVREFWRRQPDNYRLPLAGLLCDSKYGILHAQDEHIASLRGWYAGLQANAQKCWHKAIPGWGAAEGPQWWIKEHLPTWMDDREALGLSNKYFLLKGEIIKAYYAAKAQKKQARVRRSLARKEAIWRYNHGLPLIPMIPENGKSEAIRETVETAV